MYILINLINDMRIFEESSSFYRQVINLIDLNDYKVAIKSIRKGIDTLKEADDIALAYLNCGFLNDKLGDYSSAINDFSMSISIEAELEIINQRSKDISLSGRSNTSYKIGDYQSAIEDKKKAKKIRLIEINRFPEIDNRKIVYKDILLGSLFEIDLEPKYKTLIKASRIEKSRYDLIKDYKKVISNQRKEDVIKKLELLSESKYNNGDYKASIRAIRRAEKYY